MFEHLKSTLAIGAGKMTASLVSSLKLGAGTSLPGKVARKIDANLLHTLGQQIREQTIAVTGTNGKTTTCGLLAQFLVEAGKTRVHNQLGANMVPGITSELIKQSTFAGSLPMDYGVLEIDEASLRHLVNEMDVHRIVVTNLFRDQLDRYGELDTTARLIQKGITQSKINRSKNGCLYLNADDPLVSDMGIDADRVVSYAVKNVTYAHPVNSDFPVPFPREVTQCPRCGGGLYYKTVIYGHLGHYECLGCCGYNRPVPDVTAEDVQVTPQGSDFTLCFKVNAEEQRIKIHLPLPGVFNVYNFLAAAAVIIDLGLFESVPTLFETGLNHYHSVFGRAERKLIEGKNTTVFLIKNPVGASEVLKLVGNDPNGRLLFVLNDDYADGRDVSWIWDAQFEAIRNENPIMVSGKRAEDMALRLKYAGIPPERIQIERNLMQSIHMAAQQTQPDETLYIMPTYTALLEMRELLASSPTPESSIQC